MIDYLFTSKILIFSFLWYKVGLLYTILIMNLTSYMISKLLLILFNWEALNGMSQLMALLKPMEKKATLTGYMILEDYRPEEWKDMIIKKGIDVFTKLRKVLIKFL